MSPRLAAMPNPGTQIEAGAESPIRTLWEVIGPFDALRQCTYSSGRRGHRSTSHRHARWPTQRSRLPNRKAEYSTLYAPRPRASMLSSTAHTV